MSSLKELTVNTSVCMRTDSESRVSLVVVGVPPQVGLIITATQLHRSTGPPSNVHIDTAAMNRDRHLALT